jgi:hypothetical protein
MLEPEGPATIYEIGLTVYAGSLSFLLKNAIYECKEKQLIFLTFIKLKRKDVQIMSMSVKPGYINPLTTMGQKKNGLTSKTPTSQKDSSHDVQNLQTQRQALQNQILLLKSTSDGATTTEDTQDALDEQINEISAEIRTAKSQEASETAASTDTSTRLNVDLYEEQAEHTDSPDLYQVQRDAEMGYKVLFTPASEQE